MTTTTPIPDKVSIKEKNAPALGQFAAIISLLAGLAGVVGGLIWASIVLFNKLGYETTYKTPESVDPGVNGIWTAALIFAIGCFLLGFVNYQQPNTASVYTFFGNYVGTVTRTGLYVVPIPFVGRQRLSQAQSNFESATLKINDQRGNPLSVSSVVVYRVDKPAQATFAVDSYTKYLNVQVESALRHAVAQYQTRPAMRTPRRFSPTRMRSTTPSPSSSPRLSASPVSRSSKPASTTCRTRTKSLPPCSRSSRPKPSSKHAPSSSPEVSAS